MKKLFSLILVCIISVVMVSCSTAEENQNKVVEQKPIVAVITDVGGIGDYSFNDATLSALEDIQEDTDIDIRCFEASSSEDYTRMINNALQEDARLVIGVGSNMKDAISAAALANPDKYFGIIDTDLEADNIASMSFADNQSAFLAGYAAAKTSETGNIGFIGGDDRATVELFKYGYIAGAKAANADINIYIKYLDDFYDSDKGYDEATKMHLNDNVDVIMHVAGQSGLGVIESSKDNKFWSIGADKDQSVLASSYVLCSAVKNMEPGLKSMVKAAVKSKFSGGYTLYDLKDDGVALSDNAGNIKGELKKDITKLTKAIENGTITVPSTEEELENFVMPETY